MHRPNRRPMRVVDRFVSALFASLLLSFCHDLQAADPTPIAWRSELAKALDEAKTKDRLLWIQFTGSWCPNCHKMDEETFRDARVQARAEAQFIPVSLKIEDYEQYALDLGLTSLPSTVIVSPAGLVVARQEGFAEPAEFEAFLAGSLAGDGRPNARPVLESESKKALLAAIKLDGVCPVSLVSDRRLIPGDALVKASFEGAEYRFASTEARTKFLSDPTRYIPRNDGLCPVSQRDRGDLRRGDPRFGAVFRGHLYTFADGPSRGAFLKNPNRYADIDVADRGFCPHCWKSNRSLVRGLPKFSLARGGLRYWFPDPLHLSDFLARGPEAAARR